MPSWQDQPGSRGAAARGATPRRYGGACMADAVSLIDPARNGARVIGRLLARLAPAARPGGCWMSSWWRTAAATASAELAGAFGPRLPG